MFWMMALGAWFLCCLFQVARIATRATSTEGSAKWVLLLGKQSLHGRAHPHFISRISRAQSIISRKAGLGWVLSGGGRVGEPSEAQIARGGLRFSDQCRIEMEEVSRSTWENFSMTRGLLIKRGASIECVAVVSNRYHLARCLTIASALNMPVILCAAEDKWEISCGSVALLVKESAYLMATQIQAIALKCRRPKGR